MDGKGSSLARSSVARVFALLFEFKLGGSALRLIVGGSS